MLLAHTFVLDKFLTIQSFICRFAHYMYDHSRRQREALYIRVHAVFVNQKAGPIIRVDSRHVSGFVRAPTLTQHQLLWLLLDATMHTRSRKQQQRSRLF